AFEAMNLPSRFWHGDDPRSIASEAAKGVGLGVGISLAGRALGRGPLDGRNHLLKNPRRSVGSPTYILGRLYGMFAHLDQAPLLVPLNHLIRYTVVTKVLPNWYGSREDRHYLPTSQHAHWSIIGRI